MTQKESHGFCTKEEWTKWFADYNLVISNLNACSYELIRSNLPADQWVKKYQENSVLVRDAYRRNEDMLERHVRWFTRVPDRWTRKVADPLLDSLFRLITRIQDLGTAHEIAQSLLDFYMRLGDETALMKCYTVRAFSCGFLDPIHLADRVYADCQKASAIYERLFLQLTPEEQSMGLSIYDLEFSQLTAALKLGGDASADIERLIACHAAACRAEADVVAADQNYEFNKFLPDFDYSLSLAALCLRPGRCTRRQAGAIYQAAKRRLRADDADTSLSPNGRIRSRLIFRMAQRLEGTCSDEAIIGEMKELVKAFAQPLLAESSYNRYSMEAVEAIQLAVENLTRGGETQKNLYMEVQDLFIRYLSTRPYTTFVDYVCASFNYSYILTALPHVYEGRRLLQALLELTMLRQVQTAMHSIMVGHLALEILKTVIRRRPLLLAGQLKSGDAGEVRERQEELCRFIYCGAMLHDIGKLLCSSVINAQSHRLGELEFEVLRFHPTTGAEMLERLPELCDFRDIALGHQKSYDGKSGYPAEFDNTASPLRIFIDIITISDSLDAATDHLGRNYACAKDFDTVLGELRKGRGSRYSGDLVDLIDEEETLRARLRRLLEEGRRKIYYDVHNMILASASVSSDHKSTLDWLFDLGMRSAAD